MTNLTGLIRRISSRHKLVNAMLRRLEMFHQDGVIPLRAVRTVRALASEPDVLTATTLALGAGLDDPVLAQEFSGTEFGSWSLPVETLNFFQGEIQSVRPQAILEFGSGISTACLAYYMRELHGKTAATTLYSIEQDPMYLQRTRTLLERMGLDGNVRLACRPLSDVYLWGRTTTCYDITESFLDEFLQGVRPDLVVIDGPAAGEGGRLGTLPLVWHRIASGARIFLDDALRDSELEIARRWRELPQVEIEGIRLIGHGLLVGQKCDV